MIWSHCRHKEKLKWFCSSFVLLCRVGNTERQILSAIEEIVEESLPVPKMTAHYKDPEAAKHYVLNKITFCETRQKVNKGLI